jgi:phosphotriesterase-related protein
MERRRLLSTLAGAALGPLAARRAAAAAAPSGGATIQTVRGPIDPSAMGTTLAHEHVIVDFGGAASTARYDPEEVFRVVLPHMKAVAEQGVRTLVECTPAYLARDPLLLRRLSEASGLHLLTNTGYYGAADDVAIPKHAYAESARQLADRWTAEARGGIGGTGVRPGFVKIGVDAGPLSQIDRKLVEAGALCHLDTGLTLAIHTGDGRAALGILEVLEAQGVSPEAWIWVHAQNEKDRALHTWMADRGAWISLDGVSAGSLAAHVDAVVDLRGRNRLDRVLVSQDAGWYHVGEPGGGTYRPHTLLLDAFVPALRERGLAEADVHTLLARNPARAFAIGRRPRRRP